MILLTFDIEEFDMPLEYGRQIPLERQLQISAEGLQVLLPILDRHGAHATMFTTATFAEGRPELVASMCRAGHEIASHGLYHSQFELPHLQVARRKLEQVTGMPVTGYRAPRMMEVPTEAILKAGFRYSSSINPTFLPGRYNNLGKPRRYFNDNGMVQIPASVSPMRLPLFWLSLHNFPLWWYRHLCRRALRHDGYLNLYYHPWEFSGCLHDPALNMPYIARHNSGAKMAERLDSLLDSLDRTGVGYATVSQFLTMRGALK